MPKNRRPRPHDEKRAELIQTAVSLFLEHGYEGTSISALAKAAGVTAPTIYWYFEDKDALLLACADEFLRSALADYASVQDRPLIDQVEWLVDQLRPLRDGIATIHQRATHSEQIARWHVGFHETFEQLFEAQLPAPLDPATRDADILIATYALEGVIMHDIDRGQARAVIAALLARVAPELGLQDDGVGLAGGS